MPTTDHLHQPFYRGSLRAFLTCTEAGCVLEISEPQPGQYSCYHLEILHQPIDANGWPQGGPRCVYEADVQMIADHWSDYARGLHRLPFRLHEDLLGRCHFRLTRGELPETSDP